MSSDTYLQTEADALLAAPPPDPDVHHRVDLTHLPVWAIDSAETTEVDDGISIERLADGTEKLWVHVADPSRWVAMGSKLDEEAARRSITMYMPTGSSQTAEQQITISACHCNTDFPLAIAI